MGHKLMLCINWWNMDISVVEIKVYALSHHRLELLGEFLG